MQLLSLAVTAGDPEHTGTIRGGTGADTNSNANRAGLGLGAAGGASVTVVVTATVATVVAVVVVAAVVARGRILIASGEVAVELKGDGWVDHAHDGLDSLVLLLVQGGVGVELEALQSLNLLAGVVEDGESGVVAGALPGVVRLQGEHGHVFAARDSILHSLGNKVEDLRR